MQTPTATWDNLPQIMVGALWLNALPGAGDGAGVSGAWHAGGHSGRAAGCAGVGGAAALPDLAGGGQGCAAGSAVDRLSPLLDAERAVGVLGLFLPVVTWLAGAWLTGAGLAVPFLTLGLLASLLVGSVLVLYAVPLLVAV